MLPLVAKSVFELKLKSEITLAINLKSLFDSLHENPWYPFIAINNCNYALVVWNNTCKNSPIKFTCRLSSFKQIYL